MSLASLSRRIHSLVSRAVIKRVYEGAKLQTLQVGGLDDEVLDHVERFGEFGFTSVPPEGGEAIVVTPQSIRSLAVVVAVEDRRYRPKDLAGGECCLYTTGGVRVKCKVSGVIEIGTAPTDFVALASKVDQRISALESWCSSHTHVVAGVTAGAASVVSAASTPSPTPGSSTAASEVKAK